LSKYVKNKKILSLENAINKMTYKATNVFNIKDRGVLKSGMKADIVVLNIDTIEDKATYEDPMQFSNGIEYVIINGNIVIENNIYNKKIAGKIIK
jgi:N-acyl-D-amino-acid deacylase